MPPIVKFPLPVEKIPSRTGYVWEFTPTHHHHTFITDSSKHLWLCITIYVCHWSQHSWPITTWKTKPVTCVYHIITDSSKHLRLYITIHVHHWSQHSWPITTWRTTKTNHLCLYASTCQYITWRTESNRKSPAHNLYTFTFDSSEQLRLRMTIYVCHWSNTVDLEHWRNTCGMLATHVWVRLCLYECVHTWMRSFVCVRMISHRTLCL